MTFDTENMWEAFLKIGEHAPGRVEGEVVYADPEARKKETLSYLHILRDEVLPLVRRLKPTWFCFLLHDRSGGVPVPEGDQGIYIHLRLAWEGVPPITWPMQKMPAEGDAWEWEILGRQSELVLDVIEGAGGDDEKMIKGLGMMLHYFQNMAQMRVS